MPKGETHKKKHVKISKFTKYDFIVANQDEGEFYARVVGILNGNRLKVINIHGEELQVGIRGNFFFGAKKENLNFVDAERNDYWVLVQPGISVNQYFLKHIYTNDERSKLYDRGELTVKNTQNNILDIGASVEDEEIDTNNTDWFDNL